MTCRRCVFESIFIIIFMLILNMQPYLHGLREKMGMSAHFPRDRTLPGTERYRGGGLLVKVLALKVKV